MFGKMMKKICSCIAIITLSFNIISFDITSAFAADESDYQLSAGAKVLCGLGIIESTADDIMISNISRGDVALILQKISKFGEKETNNFNENQWMDDFFGELSQDLKIPKEQKEAEFGDVQENNKYYDAVTYVTTMGLMGAVEEGNFNVDGEVTYIEAAKIILDMIGYKKVAEIYGGYPEGYKQLLANNRIDFSKDYDAYMTNDDFARLLYASFDIEVPEFRIVNGIYEMTYDKKETFLSKKLGLNIIKGRVTDDGVSSFLTQSDLGDDSIAIDDMVLNIGENSKYIRSFLGYQVACYYTNSVHEDAPVAMYAEKIKEDDNITFDIDEFEELSKTNISYLSKGKLKNVKLSQGYKMIVNSMAEESYSNDIFDFDYGTVTLSRNKSGEFDLVIVEGYNSAYVMNVNKSENVIYNKTAESRDNNSIDLDDYEFVSIINNEGIERTFSEIDEGDILDISENDNIIKIVLTENKQSDILVKSVDYEENEVNDGEAKHKIAKSFLRGYSSPELVAGKTYTVYYNTAGQIAWATISGGLTEWKGAYLIKAYEKEGGDGYCMKVYTEDGTMAVLDLYDKVKFTDTEDNYFYQYADFINERIRGYSGFMRIKLFDDKVRQIELPLDNASKAKSDDRLFKTFKADRIWTNGVSFGNMAFWNDNSVVISVPKDTSDLTKYSIQSVKIFRNTTTHTVDAYGVNPKSKVSKYFLTSSSQSTTLNDTTPIMVVSKITQACNDDGEIYYLINGLNSNANNTTSIKVLESEDIMNNIKAPYRELAQIYKLEVGDVIRYTLDSDGYVDYLEIIFDANAENKLYSGEAKGWLCGSDGKKPTDSTRLGNPYVVTYEGKLYGDQLGGYGQNQGMRIIYGWVENYRDGVITVTTESPIGGIDKELEEKGISYSESYVYNPNSVTYVNYHGKTCTPINTNKSIIRDYENYASKCSRVLILTCYGSVKAAVFMDGEMN